MYKTAEINRTRKYRVIDINRLSFLSVLKYFLDDWVCVVELKGFCVRVARNWQLLKMCHNADRKWMISVQSYCYHRTNIIDLCANTISARGNKILKVGRLGSSYIDIIHADSDTLLFYIQWYYELYIIIQS